jgi:hypothetical protein
LEVKKEIILDNMDDIQYVANHTLNVNVANGHINRNLASVYMGTLGSKFIYLDLEKTEDFSVEVV